MSIDIEREYKMKCKDIQHYLREIYSSKNKTPSENDNESLQKHLSECCECREYAIGLEQLKMIKKIDIPKVSQETIRLEQVKVFEKIENNHSQFSLKPIVATIFSIAFVLVVLMNLPFTKDPVPKNNTDYFNNSFTYLSDLSYLSLFDTHSDMLLSDNEINELISTDNSPTTEELSKEIEFLEYLLSEEDV